MESGDDIMGSGPSVYRYEGMFGFDWGIGKGDFSTTGVNFDAAIPIFTTIPKTSCVTASTRSKASRAGTTTTSWRAMIAATRAAAHRRPNSVPTELFADTC